MHDIFTVQAEIPKPEIQLQLHSKERTFPW